MKQIKAIIFDFDGVFVDSWEFHAWALLDGCKKLGIKTSREEIDKVFFGKTLKEATVDFLVNKGIDVTPEKFIETKLSYDSIYIDRVPAFEKVVNFVRENTEKYKMCIASATRDILINAFLKREGLEDPFEFVIDADDVVNGKPDPEVYLKALERLNLDRDEVVVIEDSVKGVQAAKAANLFVVALTQTTAQSELQEVRADIVLDDSSQLAKIIEQIAI